jgi:streptogramin lyase
VDANGVLYTSGYAAVYKVDGTTGVATLLAGSGTPGVFVDGVGTSAVFSSNLPGVALDSSGNVYVTDNGNIALRKITPTGNVTTLASGLSSVNGVAVDSSSGTVYVALNSGANPIRKVLQPSGTSSVLTSTNGSGLVAETGGAATFDAAAGIALDAFGNLYVADSGNHAIRYIDLSSGIVKTVAGSLGVSGLTDGVGTVARFYGPAGVTVDVNDGLVYVSDTLNNAIRRIDPSTRTVTTLAGNGGNSGIDGIGTSASFKIPQGIAGYQGRFFIADQNQKKIRMLA